MEYSVKYKFSLCISHLCPFFLLLITIVCLNNAAAEGKQYTLHLRKFVMTVDESFGNFSGVKVHKYNRTATALNGTFELFTDLPDNVLIELQGYEKVGNEYLLNGIQLRKDLLCNQLDAYKSKIFFPEYGETTNFRLECPIKKGKYYVRNYQPDDKNLPDKIPGKFWRLDVKTSYPEDIVKYLFHFQVFIEIKHKISDWKPMLE